MLHTLFWGLGLGLGSMLYTLFWGLGLGLGSGIG